jgi:hyperosmotically inducible periplasmic protein
MLKRLTLFTFVAALAAISGASAQERQDLQVLRDVSDQINRYTQFTIFDSVSASVADGEARLTGWVTMPYKKDDIERRVSRLDGVKWVQNDIEVLPASQFDDELRFRIARAIYGHASFWNYAAMANPPIHIIVRSGRVTLAGVVQSDVDRMLARSLASGFGALELKNELLTDAEVRRTLETS